MKNENLYPLNSLIENPDARDSVPLFKEFHQKSFDPMSSGATTAKVKSDLDWLLGVELLKDLDVGNVNNVLLCSCSDASVGGEVDVYIESTDNTSETELLSLPFFLIGRLLPKNPS